ncbi:OLC1v1020023C1 [Oldenlandia corymbosa var. corymbosa]|uniref:OLC1v1020023C1 n=1 Tax=Oldenlandia corymbosa var. corymbosa TaxID=529605 RepID=A0AAV1EFN9_OLDCO|nr:OLC1v1020023C1 [Oldenlandia corymbosa var. corymbosa]
MRVYPLPSKRNLRLMESFDSSMNGNPPLKKLRKLPHVFGKVLELPFRSDADVLVEDCSENIRFIAKIDVDGEDLVNEMKVRAVEIHPGVTKIVVRKGDPGEVDLLLERLNIDTWRFRLPRSAQPDMASIVLVDEKLIVTVPKGDHRGFGDGSNTWRGDSRLVLVQ